jgi:hypothetical protein
MRTDRVLKSKSSQLEVFFEVVTRAQIRFKAANFGQAANFGLTGIIGLF